MTLLEDAEKLIPEVYARYIGDNVMRKVGRESFVGVLMRPVQTEWGGYVIRSTDLILFDTDTKMPLTDDGSFITSKGFSAAMNSNRSDLYGLLEEAARMGLETVDTRIDLGSGVEPIVPKQFLTTLYEMYGVDCPSAVTPHRV